MGLTKNQTEAIAQLEAAFKLCQKVGIQFCGIGDSLLFATSQCLKDYKDDFNDGGRGGNVHEIAQMRHINHSDERAGQIQTYSTYKDSGGF